MSDEPTIVELRTAGPEALARPVLHPGTPVVLRDGRAWIVPSVAELPDHATDAELADVPEDRRAWANILIAQERRQLVLTAARLTAVACDGGTLPLAELRAFCADVLRLNYRIPTAQVERLIDAGHALAVLSAALGFPIRPPDTPKGTDDVSQAAV